MNYKGYSLQWSKFAPMSIEIAAGEQGGKIPEVFKQLFTSRTVAMQHIDTYLASKKGKVKDGEANAESGVQ